jgi:hypothetical protein
MPRSLDFPALTYDQLPGLEDVYLEDSLVREIVETESCTSFTLLIALTPDHPAYDGRAPTEAHAYRAATLTFPNVRARTWHARTSLRFADAETAVDYGNIDGFTADGGAYRLEGEWGSLELWSDAPELSLVHPEPHGTRARAREYAAWIAGDGEEGVLTTKRAGL